MRTKSVPIRSLPRRLGSLELAESYSPRKRHWNVHAHGSTSFKRGHVPRDNTPFAAAAHIALAEAEAREGAVAEEPEDLEMLSVERH